MPPTDLPASTLTRTLQTPRPLYVTTRTSGSRQIQAAPHVTTRTARRRTNLPSRLIQRIQEDHICAPWHRPTLIIRGKLGLGEETGYGTLTFAVSLSSVGARPPPRCVPPNARAAFWRRSAKHRVLGYFEDDPSLEQTKTWSRRSRNAKALGTSIPAGFRYYVITARPSFVMIRLRRQIHRPINSSYITTPISAMVAVPSRSCKAPPACHYHPTHRCAILAKLHCTSGGTPAWLAEGPCQAI